MSEVTVQLPEEKVDALKAVVAKINELVSVVGDLALQSDDVANRLAAAKEEVLKSAQERQEILNKLEEEFGQGMINLEEGTLVQE